jgi:anti-sigma factor RsiW
MTEDQRYQEIEAYLTGALTEQEEAAFQKRMEEDEALARQVALQQLEHEAMQRILENELKEKMASWDKKPPPNPFEGKETSS